MIENLSETITGGEHIKRLILCYNAWQEVYGKWAKYFPYVIFHEGLPTYSDIKKWTELPSTEKSISKSLIVIDDLGNFFTFDLVA